MFRKQAINAPSKRRGAIVIRRSRMNSQGNDARVQSTAQQGREHQERVSPSNFPSAEMTGRRNRNAIERNAQSGAERFRATLFEQHSPLTVVHEQTPNGIPMVTQKPRACSGVNPSAQ